MGAFELMEMVIKEMADARSRASTMKTFLNRFTFPSI
jgi:hypothetical protein